MSSGQGGEGVGAGVGAGVGVGEGDVPPSFTSALPHARATAAAPIEHQALRIVPAMLLVFVAVALASRILAHVRRDFVDRCRGMRGLLWLARAHARRARVGC
jgi:threonine/homoserine/homoserine lactone efflux protein